jgi:hypothetical protein
MTQQLNPKVRYGKDTTESNDKCISLGMDQGFHNWLIYGGVLEKSMNLRIFPQGEGPVNTVGSFFQGRMAIIKANLTEWQVLRGEGKTRWFSNWDSQPSPVILQMDRFLDTDLKDGYEKYLLAFQDL